MKHFILLIISVLLYKTVLSQNLQYESIHEEESVYYENLGLQTVAQFDSLNHFRKIRGTNDADACNLNRVVFGWHPYWSGSKYQNYQWNLLSDLSFFSYEVDPATGEPETTRDWLTADVVDQALANGVRVNLCVTLFSGHELFFGNQAAQQKLIANLISLVQQRGAHGVNIDFEGVPSSVKTQFTDFVVSLCEQMHEAIEGSQVSICLYSVDWRKVFDIPVLDDYIDLFCIMGYGYYWSGSSEAGPTACLYTMSNFNYNISKTVTYYLAEGASNEKLVLGLPYYGRDWATVSSSVPSQTTGTGASKTYASVRSDNTGKYADRKWEGNSFSPYYVYNDNGWHQCFVDDAASLGRRYDFVNQRDIAGIAIWALGYDDGYTELWDMIRQKFTDCATTPCRDTIYDMGGPAFNHYNNEYFTYTIAPDNADFLSLKFNSFELEAGNDSLWIFDGADTTNLIGGYSGTDSPETIYSTTNSLTIKFKSDGATAKAGWEAVWDCSPPTEIQQIENANTELKIFPNPCEEKLHIESTNSNNSQKHIEIINIFGTVVYKGVFCDKKQIDVSELSAGLYFIKLSYNNVNETYKVFVL